MEQTGRTPKPAYKYEKDERFVRRVDPKKFPRELKDKNLYLSKDPIMDGYSGSRCMYETMQADFYWRQI